MNPTELVVYRTGLNFFQALFQEFSSVRNCEDRLGSFLQPQYAHVIFIYLQSCINS